MPTCYFVDGKVIRFGDSTQAPEKGRSICAVAPTCDAHGICGALNRAAATAETRDALQRLTRILTTIREEQVSDEVFGGERTADQREARQIYASAILAAAGEIDEALEEAQAALDAGQADASP